MKPWQAPACTTRAPDEYPQHPAEIQNMVKEYREAEQKHTSHTRLRIPTFCAPGFSPPLGPDRTSGRPKARAFIEFLFQQSRAQSASLRPMKPAGLLFLSLYPNLVMHFEPRSGECGSDILVDALDVDLVLLRAAAGKSKQDQGVGQNVDHTAFSPPARGQRIQQFPHRALNTGCRASGAISPAAPAQTGLVHFRMRHGQRRKVNIELPNSRISMSIMRGLLCLRCRPCAAPAREWRRQLPRHFLCSVWRRSSRTRAGGQLHGRFRKGRTASFSRAVELLDRGLQIRSPVTQVRSQRQITILCTLV